MVSLNLRLLQLLKLFYNTIFTRINTYEIEIKSEKTMRTIVILVVLSLLFSLSSCKKKKQVQTIEAPKTEVAATPAPAPVPEVKEEPKPVVREMNYFLVAGCFKVKSNADNLNARLISEGYNSKIMPFYNLYMVTYEGFETRQEAQAALNRIVQEPGKELTWVYPVK